MSATSKPQAPVGAASAFVTSRHPSGASSAKAELGRAIELAHRKPAPISPAVRIAIVLALLVAAKLCALGTLG